MSLWPQYVTHMIHTQWTTVRQACSSRLVDTEWKAQTAAEDRESSISKLVHTGAVPEDRDGHNNSKWLNCLKPQIWSAQAQRGFENYISLIRLLQGH